ncbi:MAG: helix-turn-helix domain-containing protein [Spiribacter salinus]|uniref:Helix-turn-helix domain-containing protein n=1 Tax=Spiribacter salinus TaxID=1335746 RepID=A0A540VS55_9GAMM|nr:MAG: helix-turn-helix domain-containing protein [Spiribacter salinus]
MPEATATPTPAPCNYVSTSEAAEILGVSLATVYRMLDAGELDHIRVRSLYRIPKNALQPTTKDK